MYLFFFIVFILLIVLASIFIPIFLVAIICMCIDCCMEDYRREQRLKESRRKAENALKNSVLHQNINLPPPPFTPPRPMLNTFLPPPPQSCHITVHHNKNYFINQTYLKSQSMVTNQHLPPYPQPRSIQAPWQPVPTFYGNTIENTRRY